MSGFALLGIFVHFQYTIIQQGMCTWDHGHSKIFLKLRCIWYNVQGVLMCLCMSINLYISIRCSEESCGQDCKCKMHEIAHPPILAFSKHTWIFYEMHRCPMRSVVNTFWSVFLSCKNTSWVSKLSQLNLVAQCPTVCLVVQELWHLPVKSHVITCAYYVRHRYPAILNPPTPPQPLRAHSRQRGSFNTIWQWILDFSPSHQQQVYCLMWNNCIVHSLFISSKTRSCLCCYLSSHDHSIIQAV